MRRRGFFGLLLAPLVAPFVRRLAPATLAVRFQAAHAATRPPEVFEGSFSLYEALSPEAGSALDLHMLHVREQMRRTVERELFQRFLAP